MTDQRPKPRRGCFFYGGIVAVVLFLFLLVGALVGLRTAKRLFSRFTDTAPMQLPSGRVSQAELRQMENRIDSFRQAVREHRSTQPLTLSAEELNALIATDPDLGPLKGKLFVSLTNSHFSAQMSVPMEKAGLPLFKGRYLNGTGTFAVELRNGTLRVMPQTFKAKGKPLPEVYMQQLRKQNLARKLNDDPRVSAALDALQSIEVRDSKLVLTPKP